MKNKKGGIPAVVVNFPNAKGNFPKRVIFVGPESVKIANRIVAEGNQKRKKAKK